MHRVTVRSGQDNVYSDALKNHKVEENVRDDEEEEHLDNHAPEVTLSGYLLALQLGVAQNNP